MNEKPLKIQVYPFKPLLLGEKRQLKTLGKFDRPKLLRRIPPDPVAFINVNTWR
jgi:hypothetical protein